MTGISRWNTLPSVLLLSFMLSACGGHNGPQYSTSPTETPDQLAAEPGAPAVTGDIATDAFNWYNYRRQQLGMPLLVRNTALNNSAQKHADYMKLFGDATHEETDTKNPNYSGDFPIDRMTNAGYIFNDPYLTGEVLSEIPNDQSGFSHAEALIMALGHRFIILDPSYQDAGTGFSIASNGDVYVNTDMASSGGYGVGLSGAGNIATYPISGQQNIQPNFFSDTEDPDPVPGINEVGYPISVHANHDVTLDTTTFEVRPHGGSLLVTTVVNHDSSAIAIIPNAPLLSKTTYDVRYVGTAIVPSAIDGQDSVSYLIDRSWSFTTR